MRRHTYLSIILSLALGVALLPVAPAVGQDGEAPETELVASGLRNPRGVFFPAVNGAETGEILVAEAGIGGDDCVTIFDSPEEGKGEVCLGPTGRVTAVTAVAEPESRTVVDELASYYFRFTPPEDGDGGPDGGEVQRQGWGRMGVERFQEEEPQPPPPPAPGEFATGPHDVWAMGTDLYIPIGLDASAAERQMVAEEGGGHELALDLGKLWSTMLAGDPLVGGAPEEVADLAAFESANNPDQGVQFGAPPGEDPPPELASNPYSVITGEDGVHVIDAGGNDRLLVDPTEDPGDSGYGNVQLLDVFPPVLVPPPPFIPFPPGQQFPAQAVPTGIFPDLREGGTGALVGQLTGFPFHPGAAKIWHANDELTPAADGFTNLIDVTVGPDGNVYALEFANAGLLNAEMTGDFRGSLVRYLEDGTKEVLLGDPLMGPGGMTFGPDGLLYISNCSVCTDAENLAPENQGHLLRFDAVDAEPLFSVSPDSAETTEDQPVEIPVEDNDTEGLEVTQVTDQGNGATEISSILYQPAAGVSGTQTVKYQTCDPAVEGEDPEPTDGLCAVGVVTVDVEETDIDRLDGETRIETAVRMSKAAFPLGADTVVIARSDLYPDALTGSVLAHAVGAPILLTPSDQLHPATAAEITRLGATQAYILGGEVAITPETETAIDDLIPGDGDQTERVQGADRFGTAADVKRELEEVTGEAATEVYVAEGLDEDARRGFPDVLAVAYLGAFQARPILLVTTDQLPDTTSAALEDVGTATIVGGPVAVSPSVQAAIDDIVDTVNRIEGAERYETAYRVAQAAAAAGLDVKILHLATGENWPDALVAGPLVAGRGGVLLLVHPTDLDASPFIRQFIDENEPFDDLDILGGTAAVSQGVQDQIQAELDDGE